MPPFGRGTGCLIDRPDVHLAGDLIGARTSPFGLLVPSLRNAKSALQWCHHRLSSTTSHIPITMFGMSRLDSASYRHRVGAIVPSPLRQVLRPIHSYHTHNFLIVRVLSSTLLPGFIGPKSLVLTVNLPPSVPCPASGSPIRFGFMIPLATFDISTGRLPWVRRITSPYAVQLHFGSVHRILGLALSRLLGLLPAAI